MARIAIPSKELQLHLIGPRGSYKAARVQKFTIGTDIPTETKDEIGNSQHIGDSKDAPNVTLSFSVFDVGIKVFATLTGTDMNSYPAAGVDIQNLGEVDVAALVKDPDVADYIKSIHAGKLQIRDFTYSYSVDGDSTEDYTGIGTSRRYLKYEAVTELFTTGTTSFTLSNTPVVPSGGSTADSVYSVILDGVYLTKVASAPATGEYSVSGSTVTTGDTRVARCVIVYHANVASLDWVDVSDSSMPITVRGKDVNVTIGSNSISRIQSVTINGNLNVSPVKELGNREIVGYQRQVPTVDGTITVLDTDTNLISLFATGVMGSGVEWKPGEGCASSTLDLKIELRDPCDISSPYEVKKTVYLSEISLTGDSYTSNVNDNASVTYNFKSSNAECIIYSGAMS